jgi:hypothetical protein
MKRTSPYFALAIAIVLTFGSRSAVNAEEMYRISLPVGQSVIEFPLKNFRIVREDKKNHAYLLNDEKSGLIVSFNFVPARYCYSSEDCRDYLSEVKMPKSDKLTTWRRSQDGEVYLFEYMLAPGGRDYLRQHHMHASYVRDGVWIDVHLSKAQYEEKDRDTFLDFIRSIKVR